MRFIHFHHHLLKAHQSIESANELFNELKIILKLLQERNYERRTNKLQERQSIILHSSFKSTKYFFQEIFF